MIDVRVTCDGVIKGVIEIGNMCDTPSIDDVSESADSVVTTFLLLLAIVLPSMFTSPNIMPKDRLLRCDEAVLILGLSTVKLR